MLLQAGMYLQPQIIKNVISETELNPVQFHFNKNTSLENKQRAIQKFEATLGVKSVPDPSGSDEPVFYLNAAQTKALIENNVRQGKMYAQQQIVAVSLGKYGLDCIKAKNRPEFNRVYSKDGSLEEPGFIPTSDFNYVMNGNEKYFTPIGWCRWAINVGLDGGEFEKQFRDWPVVFHGTKDALNVMSILEQGFKPGDGRYIDSNEKAVYVTPSVSYATEYAAPPHQHANRKVQLVLQLRVKPGTYSKHGITIGEKNNGQYDPNVPDSEIIWVIKSNQYVKDGLRVYGLMLQFT